MGAELTNLVGRTAAFRQSPTLASLPGASPWKELAIASLEGNAGCRDVTAKASPQLKAAIANLDSQGKHQLQEMNVMVQAKKKAAKAKASSEAVENEYGLPGVLPPLGWFDPFGLSVGTSEGKMRFYREAELKHGRVCMQASLGFLVGERYHPFFGGDIDTPTLFQFTDAKLSSFWPAIFLVIGGAEAFSFGRDDGEGRLPEGLEPGNIGYDPLGLSAGLSDEEYEELQNKEILNGRLAMISFLGMFAEELVTKEKLHGWPFRILPWNLLRDCTNSW